MSAGFEASAITPTAPGTSSVNTRIVFSLRATPATRQPSAANSLASTRPRFLAPKTRSVGTETLGGDARELRDDLVAVRSQRLLLPVGHEVDVELVDADRLQLLQFLRRLRDVAEHAEPVDDLVGDELAVRGADARVILVVVELARLDEIGEVTRDLRVFAVALDQIHDVV